MNRDAIFNAPGIATDTLFGVRYPDCSRYFSSGPGPIQHPHTSRATEPAHPQTTARMVNARSGNRVNALLPKAWPRRGCVHFNPNQSVAIPKKAKKPTTSEI